MPAISPFWFVIAGLIALYFFAIAVLPRGHGRRWPAPTQGIIPGETRHMLYEPFSDAGPVFYMFGTSWCPHCVKNKPMFEHLGSTMTIGGHEIALKYVDAEANKDLAAAHNVQGYPTFSLARPGQPNLAYNGPRSPDGIKAFLTQIFA